jgi:hypothetical protein
MTWSRNSTAGALLKNTRTASLPWLKVNNQLSQRHIDNTPHKSLQLHQLLFSKNTNKKYSI